VSVGRYEISAPSIFASDSGVRPLLALSSTDGMGPSPSDTADALDRSTALGRANDIHDKRTDIPIRYSPATLADDAMGEVWIYVDPAGRQTKSRH
jgi:hypothetical protein